jgi:tetratricopeptide (TPR) repeat protein
MGGTLPQPKSGVFASFSKSTAAATAALAGKKAVEPEDDPVSLNKVPKKIGAEVYVGAARLLENQSKFAEAEEKYREALRVSKNDLNALVGLARLYDRQGQSQKALETYLTAKQEHPTSALVANDIGLCYRRQKQLDKAMVAFGKAVELAPDNAKYRNNYAATLVDAGRTKEAFEQLSATNSAAVAHFNLAYLLQQKGNPTETIRHLQEAVSLDPSLTPASDMLVQLGANPPLASTEGEQASPHVAFEQPATRTVSHNSHAPVASYSAGTASQRVYTSVPHVESPAAGVEPSTYHIGDDTVPAAVTTQRETKERPNWASAAWAIPAGAAAATHPLPPVE